MLFLPTPCMPNDAYISCHLYTHLRSRVSELCDVGLVDSTLLHHILPKQGCEGTRDRDTIAVGTQKRTRPKCTRP